MSNVRKMRENFSCQNSRKESLTAKFLSAHEQYNNTIAPRNLITAKFPNLPNFKISRKIFQTPKIQTPNKTRKRTKTHHINQKHPHFRYKHPKSQNGNKSHPKKKNPNCQNRKKPPTSTTLHRRPSTPSRSRHDNTSHKPNWKPAKLGWVKRPKTSSKTHLLPGRGFGVD